MSKENAKLRREALSYKSHDLPEQDLREDLREGISLRDHLAGLAMQTYVVKCTWHREEMCKEAYKWADAMLAEREKRND